MTSSAIYLQNQLVNLTPTMIWDLFHLDNTVHDKILVLLQIRVTRQKLPFSRLKIEIIILALFTYIVSMVQDLTLRYGQEIIEKGFNFCSFDFAGCGNSAGQYVSLGCNERWDVLRLVDHLKRKYQISQYFLWGRSMGAATAIRFNALLIEQHRNGRFKDVLLLGIVLDSAFISLKRMAIQVGNTKVSVPQILLKAVFLMVSSSIEERGGFKFQELELQQQVEQIRCSVLLIASKDDTFVSNLHSQEIFSRLKIANKEIHYTRGEHYQTREVKITQNIYTFFQKNLKRYHTFKLNCLNNSTSNNQHFYRYELSPQKQSKSLKRYVDKQQRNRFSSSSTKMLFHSAAGKGQLKKRSNQLSLFGFNQNMGVNSIQYIANKQNIQQTEGRHKIKFLTTNKQLKLTNPNPQIHETNDKATEHTDNEDSHKNIIGDKLRKKGKNQRQKFIIFKDRNEQHINQIKFQPQRKHTKINFTIANTISPINIHQTSKSPKKISITAQQYKNHQLNMLKTHGLRLKIQDKTPRTELKIQQPGQILDSKNKSMKNLIVLGGKNESGRNSK